jgi:phospholipid/cholesterol/gamma-HCH transport system permease protein
VIFPQSIDRFALAFLATAGEFGFITTLMGCYHGYCSKGGAQGVGQATTNAVVSVSILIPCFDYISTQIFAADG